MAQNLMHYDQLVQSALRGVVREALRRVAKSGLPGEHHMYIAFRTDHPDVALSPTLKSRYPVEMTIVLQHQFWGLKVTEDYFEVGLSFNQVPENLHIPFAAIKGFYDPSVQFGMEFEVVIPPPKIATVPAMAAPPAPPAQDTAAKTPSGAVKEGSVVSLDSFRKKS